ncbi:uncharacterized protein LOC144994896 [Oryzias latipes]
MAATTQDAAAAHINKTTLLKHIANAMSQLDNQSEIKTKYLPKISDSCQPKVFCLAEKALNKLKANLPRDWKERKLEELIHLFHQYNNLNHTKSSNCALKANHNFTVMAFLKKMENCVSEALNETVY